MFLEFFDIPTQYSLSAASVMSTGMEDVVDQEIVILLFRNASMPVKSEHHGVGFVSNLFHGFRVVLNLNRLNQFLVYKHFKMGGLVCVKYLIERRDWPSLTYRMLIIWSLSRPSTGNSFDCIGKGFFTSMFVYPLVLVQCLAFFRTVEASRGLSSWFGNSSSYLFRRFAYS